MLLFGSYCHGEPNEQSDIDIFVEHDWESGWLLSRGWTLEQGGNVDAFEMPDADGWATPVTIDPDGYDGRMLLCWDKWGPTVTTRPIDLDELTALVESLSTQT